MLWSSVKWRIVLLAAFEASVKTQVAPPVKSSIAAGIKPADPIDTKPFYPLPTHTTDITDWDGAVIDTEWWQYIRRGLRQTRAPSELASRYSSIQSRCTAPENIV
ncbi:hypothetical protein DPMN_114200 [Dreissena polymorpha]|uniref:Uncharacterized protein n=1 Tax=Dreissena polymorpha TaxID=45954 RepID=A0A9D4KJN5_DREPO|nr:hypothetical protein DPMN_114200 [Dreissena polymorpha]